MLREALFGSLLNTLGLRDAESADNRHVRTSLLELVEKSQERFVIRNEEYFIEGYLAKGDGICGGKVSYILGRASANGHTTWIEEHTLKVIYLV